MSGTQSDGRRDRDAYNDQPSSTQKQRLPSDTVTLKIGGQEFTGWQDVQIVRGIELFPSHFVLRVTERLPGKPDLFPIDPGQTCQLMIGDDLVITGYIDCYECKISTKGHEITVIGRSGTEDLVDCAAGVTSGEENTAKMTFSAPTLLALAEQLCKPFGITVTEPDGEGIPLVSVADGIPQFTIPLGATVYDVLEPQAQVRQMLLLDGADGNLVLAKVGTKKAASGFTLPGSVLEAQISFNLQDRFTIYLPAFQAFDVAMDIPSPSQPLGNYQLPVRDDAAFKDQPRLDGQARYRPHFVISADDWQHASGRVAGKLGKGSPLRPVASRERSCAALARCGRRIVDAEHAGAGEYATSEGDGSGLADCSGGFPQKHRGGHSNAGEADAERRL